MALKDRGSITSAMKGSAVNIEDMFSTYVYTGTGVALDIVNGIDLATDGGMVWIKARSATSDNKLFDTDRGGANSLSSNLTGAESIYSGFISSFNNNGFSLGNAGTTNGSGNTYASWTFKKQPRFFDMVKYTGDGTTSRTINHNLDCDVGMIIIKGIDGILGWFTWHKNIGTDGYLQLNSGDAVGNSNTAFSGASNTAPTTTSFTVGNYNGVNLNGGEYIAYLFAHDPD